MSYAQWVQSRIPRATIPERPRPKRGPILWRDIKPGDKIRIHPGVGSKLVVRIESINHTRLTGNILKGLNETPWAHDWYQVSDGHYKYELLERR